MFTTFSESWIKNLCFSIDSSLPSLHSRIVIFLIRLHSRRSRAFSFARRNRVRAIFMATERAELLMTSRITEWFLVLVDVSSQREWTEHAEQTLIMSAKGKLCAKRLSSADAVKIKGFLLVFFCFLLRSGGRGKNVLEKNMLSEWSARRMALKCPHQPPQMLLISSINFPTCVFTRIAAKSKETKGNANGAAHSFRRWGVEECRGC